MGGTMTMRWGSTPRRTGVERRTVTHPYCSPQSRSFTRRQPAAPGRNEEPQRLWKARLCAAPLARHFIPGAGRFSAAATHDSVEGLKVRLRSTLLEIPGGL
jgi:hypothetical protein